jgi:hypothetical protein
MPITVVDADNDVHEFADANTWHVDELKQLHLRSASNKQVASFAAGAWLSVGRAEVVA